jgi:hypothetical protein
MEDGKFHVDGLNLFADLCSDDTGIELSAKKDGYVFEGALVHAAIDLRSRRVRQRFRAGKRSGLRRAMTTLLCRRNPRDGR